MSERKVLNKYYPPDFDPSKIPRMKLPKNRQYTVRLMAPCNMRCITCGEYVYKGKKFNARKEDVDNEDYLGIRIYRFYIKCTRCLSEISFKTDPESTDYIIEAGATRNFQALKLAEEAAEKEEKERKEEEASNPMKLLENRTKASKHEMEMLESLEELRDLNQRKLNIDYESMLHKYEDERQRRLQNQEKEDEEFIRSIYGSVSKGEGKMKRIVDDFDSDEEEPRPNKIPRSTSRPTDILTDEKDKSKNAPAQVWDLSVGSMSTYKKSGLAGLVKVKKNPLKPGNNEGVDKQEMNHKGNKVPCCDKNKTDVNIDTNKKDLGDIHAATSDVAGRGYGTKVNGPSGLSLLGSYSNSTSGSESE